MKKIDVLNRINKQMQEVLAKQEELAGDAFATDAGFEVMRENYLKERRFWNEGGPTPFRVGQAHIEGPYGEIPLRFYTPSNEPMLPAIIYLHGGGFVLGNLDTHDRIMRILAERSGAVVVGVDYRLSPEAKFPSAIEEAVTVAQYLHVHGEKYGIEGDDLSFAGDSGGANLSLGAALYLRDEEGDCSYIKTLILYYGLFGLKDSVSQRLLGGSWDGLTQSDLDYYMDCYCADKEQDMKSPYLDCLSADFGLGLPACYIAAAEFDPLRDDSATLALLCQENNIPHRYEMFTGVIHAFLHHSRMLDEANDALEHGATFFKEHHSGNEQTR